MTKRATPIDMTTMQAMRRLFPKAVTREAQRVAWAARKMPKPKGRR